MLSFNLIYYKYFFSYQVFWNMHFYGDIQYFPVYIGQSLYLTKYFAVGHLLDILDKASCRSFLFPCQTYYRI